MFQSRFLNILLLIYVPLCAALAINPHERSIWFAENLTVWIIVGVILILAHRGVIFSNLAYGLMFVLIGLHTIGGHYTFALVPFDWVTDLFGFQRNHFDRIAHFSVGFYAFAIAEWLDRRRLVANRFLLFTYPVLVIASIAAMYEIIEWLFAATAAPEAGLAYLGSQGDVWDAQKDMLADILGALLATTLYFVLRRPAPAPLEPLVTGRPLS